MAHGFKAEHIQGTLEIPEQAQKVTLLGLVHLGDFFLIPSQAREK